MVYKRKYRSRPYKKARKSGKYSRKTRFASRVKRVIMKTAETKEITVGVENQQLFHNTGVTGFTYVGPVLFNTWNLISQGAGEQQRNGKEIYPRGMSVKMWLANKLDRPNIMYRIIVCILPKTFNNARVTAGTIDPCEGMNAGSAVANYMILPIDTEKGIKVLYDKVINLQVGNSSQSFAQGGLRPAGNLECHTYKKLWIRSKKGAKCVYESNGQQDIINKPMAIYVIPYDSYGTLTTDNVASMALVCKLYWKDI